MAEDEEPKVITPEEVALNIGTAAKEFAAHLMNASEFCAEVVTKDQASELRNIRSDPAEFKRDASALGQKLAENHEEIGVNAAERVDQYVKTYDVELRGIDYYKCGYFYAYSVLMWLSNNNEDDSFKTLSSLAVVFFMDDILFHDIGYRIPKPMKRKLLRTVAIPSESSNGLLEESARYASAGDASNLNSSEKEYKWFDYFGRYGIYLIFKNVQKFYKEHESRFSS